MKVLALWFKKPETLSTFSGPVRLLDVGSKWSERPIYTARRLRFEDDCVLSISSEPIQINDVYTFANAEIGVRTDEKINAERTGTMTSTRLSTTIDSGCLGGFAYEQANIAQSHPLRL